MSTEGRQSCRPSFPVRPPAPRTAALGLVAVLVACGGCAGFRHEVCTPYRPAGARGVVFVADGAGNFYSTSRAVRRAVEESGTPLAVEPVEWSHGYGLVLLDHLHYRHVRREGERLAACIHAYRQACPHGDVYLVGHSAGSGVVLAAAEALPPDSVRRVVLLAPAVSTCYDLRPALRAARDGLDVFHSPRDTGYLGVGTALTGTTDRRWTAAAGRVGFEPETVARCEPALLARLRQHPWHPCLSWSGNHGGHYGSQQPAYFRAYVLPLLNPAAP